MSSPNTKASKAAKNQKRFSSQEKANLKRKQKITGYFGLTKVGRPKKMPRIEDRENVDISAKAETPEKMPIPPNGSAKKKIKYSKRDSKVTATTAVSGETSPITAEKERMMA